MPFLYGLLGVTGQALQRFDDQLVQQIPEFRKRCDMAGIASNKRAKDSEGG